MRGKAGIVCILLGLVLLLVAGGQFARNEWENAQAGSRADRVIALMHQQIVRRTEDPAETAAAQIDGYGYIGYISIPRLELELPVMDQWDEERLKTAPCRYSGSIRTEDLVLAGHNYRRHFGPIRRLVPGDEVTFTDMDGFTLRYLVAAVEIIDPSAVEETVSGGYPLTLLTCTYGGKERIRVGCIRQEE